MKSEEEKAAKSIASMVEEWVQCGVKNGGNWQERLPTLIQSRLKRFWPAHSIPATELDALRKKLASAERERDQSNARLHEVAVACATAERERDDAHEIIDQYKGMAARYKACMDERDALRKALQKACIGLAHASEANPLYQKNYEACEKALMAIAHGKGE